MDKLTKYIMKDFISQVLGIYDVFTKRIWSFPPAFSSKGHDLGPKAQRDNEHGNVKSHGVYHITPFDQSDWGQRCIEIGAVDQINKDGECFDDEHRPTEKKISTLQAGWNVTTMIQVSI